MDSDVLLYITEGRGILNGLVPYVDLFETKPPGMFLLTALSLKTTGDERLLGILTILCLLIVAAIPAVCAFVWTRQQENRTRRTTIIATALAAGTLVALYLERWATGMEIEIFGGAALSLYAVLVMMRRASGQSMKQRVLLCGLRALPLFVSIFLKEYFVFMALAIALLAAPRLREFFEAFILPLIIALMMHVTTLLLLGYLSGYLSIYLPVQIGVRFGGMMLEPPWLGAADVTQLFYHLFGQFPESPVFWLLIFMLLGCVPLYNREKVTMKTATWTIVLWTVLFILWEELYILLLWGYTLTQGTWIIAAHPFLLAPLALCTALLLLWMLRSKTHRTLSPHLILPLAAIYIMQYAIVGAGGAGNHFAAAAPVYIVLVLQALRSVIRPGQAGARVGILLGGLVIAAVLLYRTSADDWNRLRGNAEFAPRNNADQIARLDALMDRCGIDRFYDLGGLHPFAFARHSMWGPLPSLDLFEYLEDRDHPLARATEENLANRNLLLLAPPEIKNPKTRGFVETHFTRTPPPCAAGILPLQKREIWFRTDAL